MNHRRSKLQNDVKSESAVDDFHIITRLIIPTWTEKNLLMCRNDPFRIQMNAFHSIYAFHFRIIAISTYVQLVKIFERER